MNFTSRQIEFINFLLDQLNFNQIDESKKDRFREDYFQQLIKSYHKFKNIANCEYSIILYNDKEKKIPKNAVLSFRYKDNGAFFEIESFSIFNYLQLEIKIKEHGLYDLITLNSDYISASDIANFTYCPVSFAISKSIKSKTLSSAQIGLELHETSIINSMISSESKKEKTVNNSDEISYDENFKNLNDLLKNCEVLYSGHSQSEKIKYFKSLKGNFIGQPDFILRNKITNKIFVIEEKYHHIPTEFHSYGNHEYYNNLEQKNKKEREKQLGYENHVNQLLSYIYGIAEYQIDYGLLIYWKYEIEETNKNVTKCSFRKIDRNEKHQQNLNAIYQKIRYFNKHKYLEFNIDNRNPVKCANCVNSILCGHKTGKFNNISLPYSSSYLKINKPNFPTSLGKERVADGKSYMDKIIDTIVIDDIEREA